MSRCESSVKLSIYYVLCDSEKLTVTRSGKAHSNYHVKHFLQKPFSVASSLFAEHEVSSMAVIGMHSSMPHKRLTPAAIGMQTATLAHVRVQALAMALGDVEDARLHCGRASEKKCMLATFHAALIAARFSSWSSTRKQAKADWTSTITLPRSRVSAHALRTSSSS